MNINEELAKRHLTQSALLGMMWAKGIMIDAPELSRTLSGAPQPRYERHRKEIEELLNETAK